MSNMHERIVDRILYHLENVGRSPVDLSTVHRVTATLGVTPSAVNRALQFLILRGDLRRVGDLFVRVRLRANAGGQRSGGLSDV